MPILDEIGDLLVAETTPELVEGGTGYVLKKGIMPEDPDKVVALFEGVGVKPPEPTPGTEPQDISLRYPTVQVRVRAAVGGYAEMRARLQLIYNFLHVKVNTVIAGPITFHHILAEGEAIPLGEDKNGRPEVTQNFTMAREE